MPINREAVLAFMEAMKKHCESVFPDNCDKCCMRLFCYTPPCEMSSALTHLVIDFLEGETHRGRENPIR